MNLDSVATMPCNPSMPPLESPARLAAQQMAFAAHLRDPELNPAPAHIEDRRMAIYRELFYNSLESNLATSFPVLRRLRGDAWWHRLVRDFYREHRAHTPLFPELGRELLRYLQTREPRPDDPPFLLELAHYEWVELALALDDTRLDEIDCDAAGDLLDGVPVASPLAWPLAYRFAVQQIRPDFQPPEAPAAPTFLLIVRDPNDDIHFKVIDALGYTLMQRLHDNPMARSGRELLLTLAQETGATATDAFVAGGGALLDQLRQRNAVLGTVVSNPQGFFNESSVRSRRRTA
jgi:hypothetical protein